MQLVLAYATVVIIWSTTPLAIQWSRTDESFIASLMLRVVPAAIISLGILTVLQKKLVRQPSDWFLYFAGAGSIFPSMAIVYWSSQFIPSGMMALIFGLYPLSMGIFSYFMLGTLVFDRAKIAALFMAICGIAVIHREQVQLNSDAWYGIVGMLVGVLSFGFFSILLRSVSERFTSEVIDPFRQSAGSLLVASPFCLMAWWVWDGSLVLDYGFRSISGMAYLILLGSVFGQALFFYVLHRCSITSVSMITLITPLMAVVLGGLVENEPITSGVILGALIVFFALAIYQGVIPQVLSVCRGNRG